ITPRTGHTTFHSTVTTTPLDTRHLDATYWYRNLRNPVQLAPTITQLTTPDTVFIEISAHPVLTPALTETLDNNGTAIPTLHRDQATLTHFTQAAATAWTHGITIDWPTLLTPYNPHPTELPPYPFQHQHYWLTP
ncbi:acyltransferase domain-containing protein, partial [Streptomyces sp. AGS-58]|uniref:acyltransferase domain-containing protein n=1 Tax=unclassified Streptomyces TaxID=2593676 RepID=UPI0035A33648